ncbi:autophagy-related protein 16-1-like isoform X1 [Lytechinus variegatus]|uniref:autophagy-related protein 16-1-like isoform X1 n=1 Tax=Lytechinus variegatus TaxID=7654 RepID=UPI001BB1CE7B|nr:autophagy-related protein 16-1-like isoform X1 [Lytechinus variegatus]
MALNVNMATSMDPSMSWKKTIQMRVRRRNERESLPFKSLIETHIKLSNQIEASRSQNVQLQVQVERLQQENTELQSKGLSSPGPVENLGKGSAAYRQLEQKCFKLNEELTDVHRKKGENAQQLIDLTAVLKTKETELQKNEESLNEALIRVGAYEDEIRNLETAVLELRKTNENLKDELQNMTLLCTKNEEALYKLQAENAELVTRVMDEKGRDADRLNSTNAIIQEVLNDKLKKELEEAASEKPTPKSEPRSSAAATAPENKIFRRSPSWMMKFGPGSMSASTLPRGPILPPPISYVMSVPDKNIAQFEAHDGEVHTVKFCPSGTFFATGGADRQLKLWEFLNNSCQNRGVLLGSNLAVTCIDFDDQEQLILGAANDCAIRIWGTHDHRLRQTLTGHSNKVLAAKFLSDPNKFVSGSHDRTLKIWDLKSRACTRTMFAGSMCNDLVTSDGAGTNIISGHVDKKIRFWDARSNARTKEIQLNGKVTSLDLSPDRQFLLSCTREDTLKIVDLRMYQVVTSCSAEGFNVGCDYTRAAFSPDGEYVTAGSQDGSIFYWKAKNGEIEKQIKDHKGPVICVSWHPSGRQLISCDRAKNVILWADF